MPGALYPGVKWPGNESDHSSPFTVKAKYEWSYIVHTGAAKTCFCYSFIELSQNNLLEGCKVVTGVESLKKMAVILVVMPCSLVEIHCFRGRYILHLERRITQCSVDGGSTYH